MVAELAERTRQTYKTKGVFEHSNGVMHTIDRHLRRNAHKRYMGKDDTRDLSVEIVGWSLIELSVFGTKLYCLSGLQIVAEKMLLMLF